MLNMLPKLELVPIMMYLQDVGERAPAFEHAVVQDLEVVLEQDEVGGFLGDVDGACRPRCRRRRRAAPVRR